MRTRRGFLLTALLFTLAGSVTRTVLCQEAEVQREIAVVTKVAGPDVLDSLLKAGVSPLTAETKLLAQTKVHGDTTESNEGKLSDEDIHKLIQSLPRSSVINVLPPEVLPVDGESILEILLDPTKNPKLPPGVVIAPKMLKELLDGTKGQLIEEKVKVIKNSNLTLTPEAEASVRKCESALHAYQIALPQRAPGSAAPAIAAVSSLVAAEAELEKQCVTVTLEASTITSFGVLESTTGDIVCGALLLTPSRIATAYHCLIRDDLDIHDLSFRPLSEPSRRIPLTEPVFFPGQEKLSPAEAARIENDFIGADLSAPVAAAPRICFDHPVALGEELSLVAYWPLVQTGGAFADSIRREKSGGCIALTPASECFAHSCSALPNQSGSPIFTTTGAVCNGVHVAGLHVNGKAAPGKCGSLTTNSAVAASRLSLLMPLTLPKP